MAVLPETIKMHELRHSAADNLWRETGNIVHAKLHPSMDELTSARPPPIEVFRYALLFTRSLCARSTL